MKGRESKLPPDEEWDFGEIPPEERAIAAIYEYAREHSGVRSAISLWLKRKYIIGTQQIDGSVTQEECDFTVRESLKRELILSARNKGSLYQNVIRGDDPVPEKIYRHRIFKVKELLVHWPLAYVEARKRAFVKHAIERILADQDLEATNIKGLYAIGRLSDDPASISRKVSNDRIRFKGHEEYQLGLWTYGFEIDFSFNDGEIVKEFLSWLKAQRKRVRRDLGEIAEPPGRGRVDNIDNPDYQLKALAALRIWGRPEDRAEYGSFKTKVKELLRRRKESYGAAGDLLPLFRGGGDVHESNYESQKAQEDCERARVQAKTLCKKLNSVMVREVRPWPALTQEWEEDLPDY